MVSIDFSAIIQEAWNTYDPNRPIKEITDVSAMVSTNHVYKVLLQNGQFIIAKLSYFGQYEHFVEDHTIINVLSNNLPYPFDNFLSRALMNQNGLFVHRFNDENIDAWVIFYRPVQTKGKLPNRLDPYYIDRLGREFAAFHQACHSVRTTLPVSSKDMITDLNHLMRTVNAAGDKGEFSGRKELVSHHCHQFKENLAAATMEDLSRIPVFVDWNIGNFSITEDLKLFSRWDYDWFRMTTRMMDFYFLSRIVSDVGDKTSFSYLVSPMKEERFIRFLQVYHEVFPFNPTEILFLKEVYRFFILHYVIHFGNYFFLNKYASRLQAEAYDTYLKSIDTFDPKIILKALNL